MSAVHLICSTKSTSVPIDLPNKKCREFTYYANMLKGQSQKHSHPTGVEPIPVKTVSYANGIPRIVWTVEEVDRMNTIENLQFAVVGKFSYG
ncbi:hypothetical protein R3W88_011883 [Solanum pinnatisectum]|uniref:Uncharacterized protein n=1 Tax=Solanum pinnatisectum TaxID=50273 RepID=A0AAV9L9X3_9SOLN|nr:hypothetical protein R3W88_011883 [Solanum pinnatisectum]